MGNVLIIFYWTVISQHTHSLMWLYLPNDPDKLSFDEDTLEFIQLESRKSPLKQGQTSTSVMAIYRIHYFLLFYVEPLIDSKLNVN